MGGFLEKNMAMILRFLLDSNLLTVLCLDLFQSPDIVFFGESLPNKFHQLVPQVSFFCFFVFLRSTADSFLFHFHKFPFSQSFLMN